MAHRCCGWLDLRRGTVAIALFYVCYLLLLTLTLAVLAAVYAAEPALAGRLGLATGGLLLLALLAGALLFGAVRRRRPLLLLWLLSYGAALLTLTLGVFGLAIAAETGQRTFITDFCATHGRCSWRVFHYLLLLYAVEWYWWAVVLLRYRQMGREALPEYPAAKLPGVTVCGAHNGQMRHVPVTYYGDDGMLRDAGVQGTYQGYGTGPMEPANQGRHLAVLRGF